MINEESILSIFDDKPTLYQWLRKVEAALKNASAIAFHVNEVGNATFTLSIDFEDGTSLESERFILNKGDSVVGAHITNGHLILTISNGDELDAGNLGAISNFNINDSQHLIVNYQDGTTQDLGAIFNGNVNITGNVTASKFVGDTAMETIKDANGNLRFIEGDATISIPEKVDATFAKWSLSGSHLLLVVAGSFKAGVSLADEEEICAFASIPQWILNKIYPLKAQYVDFKTFTGVDDSTWSKVNYNMILVKYLDVMRITKEGAQSFTNKSIFRFVFDILIDNQ